MIEKLSPAPWYFVTPSGGELETLVFNDHDQDVPVLTPEAIGEESCTANWDFIAFARSDLAVQMKRGWHAEKCSESDEWVVPALTEYIMGPLAESCLEAMYQKRHPVRLLTKADEWYRVNVEDREIEACR